MIQILSMAKMWQKLPSEIIGISDDDEYTAFCFNEACSYIMTQMEDDKKPIFKVKVKSFRDIYNK